ncbi:hypothetical protein M0Q50_01275 [bacterium]|jgi:hypothetical protein|nr:hypothetical protein [bacterium]
MTRTLNVDENLFKRIKIYCAINDIKIGDYVTNILKKEMDINDNNENGKDKNEK